MVKKIIALVIVLLFAGGGIYYYLTLKKQEIPANNAIKAIPIDASFIFESKKTIPLWKNISQTNEIWKDLLGIPYFEEMNVKIMYLDSMLSDNPKVNKILENQSLFISAHPNGLNKFDYLFICALSFSGQWSVVSGQSDLQAFLDSLGVRNPENNIQYEESVIHCIKKEGKPDFYYTLSNGLFISSFQAELIKESLRQLGSGISLLNNVYFTKVLNASGGQPAASLFFNFQTLNNVSSHLAKKEFHGMFSAIQDFAQWMELDISLSPDELIMTGFTDCDTTANQFISLFQNQASREIKAASVAPANTAFMICQEFSDYSRFAKDYKEYRTSRNNLKQKNEWLKNVNEVSLVITEPTDSTFVNDTYILVNTNDIQQAEKSLEIIADSVSKRRKNKFADSEYMHHPIHNLKLENITSNLLGSSFAGVTKSWYTSAGNYIVFANSMNALKMFIYQYESGNTLEKDTYYKDYIKQHVESESGIYVYNNMALSQAFYSRYLEKSYSAEMKKHKDAISKFHAVSMQFSYMQGMFYTNFYLKRNPLFKKEITPLWQVALDTTRATPPYWVTEYSTHGQYIMVEDKNSTIYFISNNGQIKWKKKIDGDLISSVYPVDAMHNKKIQYLFNTADYIHLIDKKGKELDGFPVKLKYSATGPLNLFDYTRNRNYRLLIPCEDRKVREYDISGNAIKNWNMTKTSEPIKCEARYCSVAGKDYLIFIDEKGKAYAVDREGNEKLNLDNRLPAHIRKFYVRTGNTLSETFLLALDSTGTVFKLSLSGQLSTIQYMQSICKNSDFMPAVADSTGKQEMLFMCGKDLYAYNSDKTEHFHTSAKDELNNTIMLFAFPNHELRIGAVDGKNQRIYLWDNSGNICPGFPLFGSENFSIADMKNDGSLYLVTGADNKVYVYGLQ